GGAAGGQHLRGQRGGPEAEPGAGLADARSAAAGGTGIAESEGERNSSKGEGEGGRDEGGRGRAGRRWQGSILASGVTPGARGARLLAPAMAAKLPTNLGTTWGQRSAGSTLVKWPVSTGTSGGRAR